jgi:acetyl esterase
MATDGQYEIEERDVEYLTIGGQSLLARIYSPLGAGPFPMVIDVHGGVWTVGSRESGELLDRTIARSGVLVVAVDFRQPPADPYPASLADIHFALRWMRANAARLNAIPSPIGGVGTSSGGHQLMLLALRPDDERYAAHSVPGVPGASVRPDYLVLCWPIVDPLARYRWAKAAGVDKLVSRHDGYWGSEESMQEGNPQAILAGGIHANLPPILVLQGTADGNIPAEIVERFAETYAQTGGDVAIELFADAPHGFIKRRPDHPQSDRARRLILDFIHKRVAAARISAGTTP